MLSRRKFLLGAASAAATWSLTPSASATSRDSAAYNVVLIMADDLGFEILSSYGGRDHSTPNLARMAVEGIQFENCFAMPLCGPTRATLMTGLYPFRTGWVENLMRMDGVERLEPRATMLATVLRERGYATAVVGKWQLAYLGRDPHHPRACGFDEHCLWTGRFFSAHERAISRSLYR